MPTAITPILFVDLPPELADAALSEPVLTPNERLAKEATAACHQRQIEQGRRAWPKPRIESVRGFLRRRFDAAETGLEVLSAEAELLLWRDVAEAKTRHLAETAAQAWALAHSWGIDIEAPAVAKTASGRLFQRWARRFRAELEANHWITGAQLADRVVARSESLHLLGFERIEPQIAGFLDRIEQAGGRIHHPAPAVFPAASPAAEARRVRLASRADEISAAAQWARQVLAADGNARIGVVFPYLSDAYHAMDHAFGVEFADAPQAFDLSGGLPLAQQPVWRSADALLAELMEPEGQQAQTPAHRPFVEAPQGPSHSSRLVEPGWADTRQAFGAWVATFSRILNEAQWGAKVGSVQYQALKDIRTRLDHYARLPQRPWIDAQEALQTLRDLLGAKVFAPQRPVAPIQVLGYLETTGLRFSHLWVAGLSDAGWPVNPPPNPLIPMELQRQCGIPRIDHQSEGEFAQQRLAHWRSACRSFTASWHQEGTDGPHGCSALIRRLEPLDIADAIADYRSRRHPWLAQLPPFDSEVAPPDHATPFDETIRKGTKLLQDQAQCPFRAWAVHRLGLSADEPAETFPGAMARGTVIHEAFHALYRDCQRPFSDGDIQVAAERAVAEHLAQQPDLFRAQEVTRIGGIIKAWIANEAKRPDFTVAGLEQEAELELPGARFRLRIDRIDQDRATGAKIVIDYKTGNLPRSRLVDERLTEPQLPMYALTDDGIQAVLVAKVGDEGVRLDGWSAEDLAPGGKPPKGGWTPEGGWAWQHRRWRERIEALVEEFQSGEAAVAPKPNQNQACRYCHLSSLCRVNLFEPAPDA